ncbi:hypothetical protein VOLCADRAFT_108506 [Volvox carteri f. nagariensis]|uniref:Sulfotransferase n=1 Tax=Volvox carteri f. nagariensis TaxID=3068 RepID=D8UKI7_VOLCA|nr:uncharacterized protein VOLCADRAFT_108506 [Volvox carteri f. nagariensis]EFJ39764.1 hypothetical protein VOLCADRAFT_108506 [Volvox carteri f. nagariensis]|eukprot:XP_002959174.1 hypothetical protein VOLCADRAFT_108506 [Volvox carteri f. nagariensis]
MWHSSLWQLLLSIISAFLTTISASKGLPPIDLPQSPSDYYSDLVTVSSKVYGEVKKSGPLPAERYDEKLFNQSAFRDWLLLKVVYRENVTVPAPMSYRCGVFVNHDYKLIFIRNRKAASTTVLDTFKTACKSQKVMCMKPFSEEEMEARGLTHDTMWNSYYVISSTRNPWARAASGYDYAQDRWPVKTGVCGVVPFRQFCTNPYLLGTMGNMFRCGAEGSFRGDDSWAYDFYHVEPAHHCMTDASGAGLAVDFLIRYEHLHEDFTALVDIINERRKGTSLPELKKGRIRWRKQGVYVQATRNLTGGVSMWREDAAALVSSDRHAVRYRGCGVECVNDIAKFFAADMQLMKIETPPAVGGERRGGGRKGHNRTFGGIERDMG